MQVVPMNRMSGSAVRRRHTVRVAGLLSAMELALGAGGASAADYTAGGGVVNGPPGSATAVGDNAIATAQMRPRSALAARPMVPVQPRLARAAMQSAPPRAPTGRAASRMAATPPRSAKAVLPMPPARQPSGPARKRPQPVQWPSAKTPRRPESTPSPSVAARCPRTSDLRSRPMMATSAVRARLASARRCGCPTTR